MVITTIYIPKCFKTVFRSCHLVSLIVPKEIIFKNPVIIGFSNVHWINLISVQTNFRTIQIYLALQTVFRANNHRQNVFSVKDRVLAQENRLMKYPFQ